jgi:Dolichyl-phosphate-mannose-protein mannosyltransferase
MNRTATVSAVLPRTVPDAYIFAGIVAIALALRLVFVSLIRPTPVSDFGWYYQHAIQIDNGLGFTTNGFPTAYWPLGWPYFLAGVFAVFGQSAYAGEVAQAVVNALTVGLVFLIGYATAGIRTAVAAGLTYAFLPSAIEWSSVLAAEPLYTFLSVLAICMWLWISPSRLWWFAASGVAIGAAALVRPTSLFLCVPLLVYLCFTSEKKTFRQIVLPPLVVLLFAALTIAPDIVRNYRVFHEFVLICNTGGLTLWTGNNPYYRPGDTLLYHERLQKMIADPRTEAAADRLASEMAVSYIKHHPARTAALAIPKLKALYGTDDGPIVYAFQTQAGTPLGRTVKLVNRTFYYAVLLLALVGAIWCFRRSIAPVERSRAWILPLLVIFYNSMPFVILPGYDRYHYSTMPFFAVFAGAGIAALWSTRNERRSTI